MEKAIARQGLQGVEVSWKAFLLAPTLPLEGIHLKRYFRERYGMSEDRLKPIQERLSAVGRKVEISFGERESIFNTVRGHRLLIWARRQQKEDEAVEALFKSYFERCENVADIEVLVKVAKEIGLDEKEAKSFLSSEEGLDVVMKEVDEAREQGVHGVPFFEISHEGKKTYLEGAQPPEVFEQVFAQLLRKK